MNDAYIVAPLRTPIGKFGGALASLTAEQLARQVITAVLERSGLPAQALDEVIAGQSYASSEAPCLARYAALAAGLPIEVPGYTLDRRCGSGLQAVINAASTVQLGQAEAVMVVGVESMSNIEYYSTDMRWGRRAGSGVFHDRLDRGRERSQPVERFGVISGMPETADNLAQDFAISRQDADAFAVRSHQLAARAWAEGRFADEVIPVRLADRKGNISLVERDEGIRPDSTVQSLAGLRPLRAEGICTAGNSSQQNDAAAGCLVVSARCIDRYGLRPLAKLVGWGAAGCDPSRMGIGPVPATQRLLDRCQLSLSDIDLIEVNEAFATQALAVLSAWKLSNVDRVNVNGSGISLGHPIGATGVRILTTMVHEMQRRGARYGLETMCIGGGQGLAALFENV